jgi:hypothetical protein
MWHFNAQRFDCRAGVIQLVELIGWDSYRSLGHAVTDMQLPIWVKARQGKARQGKARQGKGRQGKARQSKPR